MPKRRRSHLIVVLLFPAMTLAGALRPAAAQDATVSTEDATEFLGRWYTELDAGTETIEALIDIRDDDGHVAAAVVEVGDPEADAIEQIGLEDGDLVLDYLGTGYSDNPYQMRLSPSGDELFVHVEAANGLLQLSATASPTDRAMP